MKPVSRQKDGGVVERAARVMFGKGATWALGPKYGFKTIPSFEQAPDRKDFMKYARDLQKAGLLSPPSLSPRDKADLELGRRVREMKRGMALEKTLSGRWARWAHPLGTWNGKFYSTAEAALGMKPPTSALKAKRKAGKE